MSDDYRSGQGSIIPTMLVGLGGVGSSIVDRIAARAERLPNWDSQLRPLTTFVSIDTNELDQHDLRYIPDGNRINISAFDKAKAIDYFRRSKDPQALQWLDRAYQPRPGFKPGAGQIRVSSGEEISVPVPGPEDVLSFAAGVVATDPSKEFVLKADKNVPYSFVDKVIDALKQAKVEVIYLLSEQKTVEEEAVEETVGR